MESNAALFKKQEQGKYTRKIINPRGLVEHVGENGHSFANPDILGVQLILKERFLSEMIHISIQKSVKSVESDFLIISFLEDSQDTI